MAFAEKTGAAARRAAFFAKSLAYFAARES